jgi:hypothetical protein
MSAEPNLGPALKVAGAIRELVPNSSNLNWSRNFVMTASGGVPNLATQQQIDAIRPAGGRRTSPTTPAGWLAEFKEVDQTCRKARVGNCGELAAMACLMLHQQGIAPLEYVQISSTVTNPALPHLIAVIARDKHHVAHQGMDIGLPSTWYSFAVICDPWAKAAYYAQDYATYWPSLYLASGGQPLTVKVKAVL